MSKETELNTKVLGLENKRAENLHVRNSEYIFLPLQIENKTTTIERSEYWEINIIQTVKLSNKRWCD